MRPYIIGAASRQGEISDRATSSVSMQDNKKKTDLKSIILICACASFLLTFVETAFCVLGGWRLPWKVTLGLYFLELALGLFFFFTAAVVGLTISKLCRRQGLSLVSRAIYLGFPLIFGFHWLIGIDTPALRYRNLSYYCIISAALSLVWICLGLLQKGGGNTFGRRSFAYLFLFAIASLSCFDVYLHIARTDFYFPHFFAAYAGFFVLTGSISIRLESMAGGEKQLPTRPSFALVIILLTGITLAFVSQLKTTFLDRRPVYGAKQGSAKSKPNVILISLDTLRADHLSCYGYENKTSPNIDALAGQGVRFEYAVSQASWTLPSHSSLMTSRYPYQLRNHIIGNNASLPEILRENGYTTVAFTGGDFVSARAFGRHFDFFDDQGEQIYRLRQSHSLLMSLLHLRRFTRRFGISIKPLNIFNHWRFWRPKLAVARASFSAQRRNAAAWLSEHGHDNAFFLFLHTYSIHDYFLNRKTAKQNAELFNPGYDGILDGVNLDYHSEYPRRRQDIDRIRALYDGEVLDADRELGIFIDCLKKLGLWENSVIILLSDHGEGFDPELNRLWHGDRLSDDLLRVPLIIVHPGILPAGKVVTSQVALLDIMPTILNFLDIPAPEGVEGRSLKPILAGEGSDLTARNIYSEVAGWDTSGVSLRSNKYKYIKYPDRTEFYELKTDPREIVNLVDTPRAKAKAFQPLVDDFFIKARRKVDYDKETLDHMKAVGYLQ